MESSDPRANARAARTGGGVELTAILGWLDNPPDDDGISGWMICPNMELLPLVPNKPPLNVDDAVAEEEDDDDAEEWSARR